MVDANGYTLNAKSMLSTSQVCDWLGLSIRVPFLKSLGVQPCMETSRGTYWRKADLETIRDLLIDHLGSLTGSLPDG